MCFGGNTAMGSGSVSSSQSSSGSTSSKPKRSAGRGSGANKTTKQFATGVVSNIATDLKMGLATFGQSKEKQAETLSEMGYSPKAIDSYQARTEASKKRAAETMAKMTSDDKPAPKAAAPAPAQAVDPRPQPTDTVTPPPAPKPPTPIADAPVTTTATTAPVTVGGAPEPVTVGQTSAASGEMDAAAIEAVAEGDAEKKVADTARKGRRATVATGAQGLLTTARTRRRRSLMGGGEPIGLIS